MAANKVFWDTNVLIDFLLARPHDLHETAAIFDEACYNHLQLYTAESAITTAVYVCRNAPVDEAILTFLDFATILPTTNTIVIDALRSGFTDKEDAILYHLALHHRIEVFITRDKKHFSRHAVSSLPVMSAKEFMKSWE